MNPHGITTAKIIPLELARLEESATSPDEVDLELLPFFEEEAKIELQAIETELRAWDSGNTPDPLKKVRRHFHTIKGAANSIGHLRIGALASGMEDLCGQFNPAYAFVLRGPIIKTCITVIQAIHSLIEEVHRPEICPVKKEQLIRAAQTIAELQVKGMELQGAA